MGMIFSNTDSYTGNFDENGVLHKYGRMVFKNGDIYHGDVKNGLFEGFGYFYQT